MWRLMCIDPSTRNLGWAAFDVDDPSRQAFYVGSRFVKITDSDGKIPDENVPGEDEKEWISRSDFMVDKLMVAAKRIQPRLTLIELPRVMPGHEAAMRSDAITKLAFNVGEIRGTFRQMGYLTRCVPVNQWKGQTDKQITAHRVLSHWNLAPDDNNECDAVGIGDYYVRKVLRYQPNKVPTSDGAPLVLGKMENRPFTNPYHPEHPANPVSEIRRMKTIKDFKGPKPNLVHVDDSDYDY